MEQILQMEMLPVPKFEHLLELLITNGLLLFVGSIDFGRMHESGVIPFESMGCYIAAPSRLAMGYPRVYTDPLTRMLVDGVPSPRTLSIQDRYSPHPRTHADIVHPDFPAHFFFFFASTVCARMTWEWLNKVFHDVADSISLLTDGIVPVPDPPLYHAHFLWYINRMQALTCVLLFCREEGRSNLAAYLEPLDFYAIFCSCSSVQHMYYCVPIEGYFPHGYTQTQYWSYDHEPSLEDEDVPYTPYPHGHARPYARV